MVSLRKLYSVNFTYFWRSQIENVDIFETVKASAKYTQDLLQMSIFANEWYYCESRDLILQSNKFEILISRELRANAHVWNYFKYLAF